MSLFSISANFEKCNIASFADQWIFRMRVQTADKKHYSNPHDFSQSIESLWSEKLCVCNKQILYKDV